LEEIKIEDKGLKRYISLEPVLVPRTGGRRTKVRFHKSYTNIVERLMNKLMVSGHKGKKHKLSSGHNPGKVSKVYGIVERAFTLIENETKKNPIAVFVKAIENAAPREEITTIEYGGAKYPKSVDSGPQRRVDLTLKNMVQGAYSRTFKSKKKAEKCLAEEILNAYNLKMESNAIAKKMELERQADSSR
ncbi:unnamed protein product, partial [marine sediment metagenome]